MKSVPRNWRKQKILEMASVLGQYSEMTVMQARADMNHICNHFSTFHQVMRAVNMYTKKQTPLSYILKNTPFLNLNLNIRPPILIPRPETEHWIKWLIDMNDLSGCRILDVGTGSGCIAISLAKVFPTAIIHGIDISKSAIKLATENAVLNEVENVQFEQISFDNFTTLTKYDMIVSNPPYIPSSRRLPKSVKCHEDKRALYSGHDGMDLINKLVNRLYELTTNNHKMRLIVEFDAPNRERVKTCMTEKGFIYEIHNDQFERPRFCTVS